MYSFFINNNRKYKYNKYINISIYSSVYYPVVSAKNTENCNGQAYKSGNSVLGNGGSSPFPFGFGSYYGGRVNIDYGSAFTPSGFNISIISYGLGDIQNGTTICVYGSNSSSDYSDITDFAVTGNMFVLCTMTYGSTNNPTPGAGFQTITTSTQYRYYIIILNNTNSAYATVTLM